jgi:hypothetical protein
MLPFSMVAAESSLAEPPVELPTDPAAREHMLALAGEGFKIRETDHYLIAYDTPYDVVRSFVDRLEGTYNLISGFCADESLEITQLHRRLQVLLFNKYEDYETYCRGAGADPRVVSGFYEHETNIAIFGNVKNRPEFREVSRRIEDLQRQIRKVSGRRGNPSAKRELVRELTSTKARRDNLVERYNRLIVQHEAAHQMLFNMGVHNIGAPNPGWLVEGLAVQFEVPQTKGVSGLRRANQMRLSDFRESFQLPRTARRATAQQIEAAFSSGRCMHLKEFIGDARLFHRGGDMLPYRYAQAWALVFYLHRQHREQFAEYVRSVAKRPAGLVLENEEEIRDFEAVFGPINDEFEQGWLKFVLSLPVKR